MQIDLETLDRASLERLRKDVEKALVTLADRERKAALAAAEQAALEYGFKLSELATDIQSGGRSRAKGKNPAKYRNPENPNQTWTGRGRKPQWIKDAQDAGTDIAEFEI